MPAENIPDVNGTTYPDTDFKIIITVSPEQLTYDIVFVVWNCWKFPFNITTVRKALAYATPYQKIYSEVYYNLTAPLYGVIPKGMFGYTEKNIIKYTYDPAKAKELIDKSGIFKSSFTIIIPWFNIPTIALPVFVVRRDEE